MNCFRSLMRTDIGRYKKYKSCTSEHPKLPGHLAKQLSGKANDALISTIDFSYGGYISELHTYCFNYPETNSALVQVH